MSRWLTVFIASQFVLGILLIAAPTAMADPLDRVVPPGILWRIDADGGRTWQLQIDDDPNGPIAHRSTWLTLPPEQRAMFAPHVQDLGVYSHTWASAPTRVTVGIYTTTETLGLERHPLFIAENAPTEDLVALVDDQLVDLLNPLLTNQRPYLFNFLLPSTALLLDPAYGEPSTFPGATDRYADRPTVYLWTVHKQAGGTDAWQGWYFERIGSHGDDGVSAHAERRIGYGSAMRVGQQTEHLAGVFVHEENRRVATGTASHMEQTIRVGTNVAGIHTPLVTMRSTDDRSDAQGRLTVYPDHQRTGYAIGIDGPTGFVPLVGTYTESHSEWTAEGIPNTRTTSVGVFVDGSYEPVAGFRYEGERWPVELWALLWALTGGPGTDVPGDWETTAGYFVTGAYRPVASLRYDDTFADAHHRYQMMIRFGVYANGYDGPYQALLGVTYDGTLPLVLAALAAESEWMVSAGTFVLEAYVPLVGINARTWRDGAALGQHERYDIGVFTGHYDGFVPLVFVTWDGHTRSAFWAADAPTRFASPGRNADIGVGTVAAGKVAGVEYRSDPPSDQPYKFMTTAGVFVGGAFVPVAAVAYCSSAPGADGLSPANGPRLLMGVYVGEDFVPLARVHVSDDPNRIRVDPAPSAAC